MATAHVARVAMRCIRAYRVWRRDGLGRERPGRAVLEWKRDGPAGPPLKGRDGS
jgi:hypothetical protein